MWWRGVSFHTAASCCPCWAVWRVPNQKARVTFGQGHQSVHVLSFVRALNKFSWKAGPATFIRSQHGVNPFFRGSWSKWSCTCMWSEEETVLSVFIACLWMRSEVQYSGNGENKAMAFMGWLSPSGCVDRDQGYQASLPELLLWNIED